MFFMCLSNFYKIVSYAVVSEKGPVVNMEIAHLIPQVAIALYSDNYRLQEHLGAPHLTVYGTSQGQIGRATAWVQRGYISGQTNQG